MPADPETAPIFVVGTGRSGTTLLRMMLCAHPRIYLTHEASFYAWDGEGKLSVREYLGQYIQGFSYRWLRLDPRPVLDSLSATPDRKEFNATVMRSMAARHGKVRWGDKTPAHSNHIGRILDDYPDARVVRIVRDPRDVARSLNRMPWWPASLISAAILCGTEHSATRPYTDRILEIRMEDLVADPRAVMGEVLGFVGEDFDEAVLAHWQHLPEPIDLPPVPWFQSATKRPGTPPPREMLAPAASRLLEFLNRKVLADHGYTRRSLDTEPGLFAVVWCYLSDLPEFLRSAWVLMWLVRRSTSGDELDDAARAYQRTLNPSAWSRYPDFRMPDTPRNPDGWEAHLPD